MRYLFQESTIDDLADKLTLLEEDEVVTKSQLEEDIEIFGDRGQPLDPDEAAQTPLDYSPVQGQKRGLTALELSEPSLLPMKRTRMEDLNVIEKLSEDETLPDVPPIFSWLESTSTPNVIPISGTLSDETTGVNESARVTELVEIESFKNVYLPAPVDIAEKGLGATSCDDEQVEFGARIFYRNIMDRYPEIPKYLAQRLARANFSRAVRLHNTKTCSEAAAHIDIDPYMQQADLPPDLRPRTQGPCNVGELEAVIPTYTTLLLSQVPDSNAEYEIRFLCAALRAIDRAALSCSWVSP